VRASCSEIEVSTSSSKGVSHECAYDQPASSEHDRRHDGPADGAEDAEGLHPQLAERFTAFLGRSPETATADDIRRFQLDLAESALSIFNRNSIVSGVKFLFRVTLRRLDLVAEFYPVRKPVTIPPVLSADEVDQLLTAAKSLRVRVMLSLAYGCGLRAGEVIRLRAGDIDSAQSERLSFAINAHSTSSASCSPRDARTGLSCCRPACWHCRGSGGWSVPRARMPA
jgi:hypothetical protein